MSEAMEITLARIEERVNVIQSQLTSQFVTRSDFNALEARLKLQERISFTAIGAILLSVLAAIGSLVIKGAQ